MNNISVEALNNIIYKNDIAAERFKQKVCINEQPNKVVHKDSLKADEFSRLVKTASENQLKPIQLEPIQSRSSLLNKIIKMIRK